MLIDYEHVRKSCLLQTPLGIIYSTQISRNRL